MSLPRKDLLVDQLGFSLVEVTIAIGVVSFCLLTVIGLLPVGLGTLREAIDQTVQSQIAQKLAGEILLTPYSQLTTKYAGSNFYFDDAGSLVTAVSDRRHQVQIILTNPVYPGSSNAPTNTPIANSIQTVQMTIVKMPGAQSNRYTIQVPNSGN